MQKFRGFIKQNIFIILIFLASLAYLLIALKINFFRYNNFDYGKFDLGNMTQMVWNATHGRGLMLTDYFGTNLPRWSMSHVDPILYLMVPFFAVFPHPMTLVVVQLILVIFSSFLVYLIASLHLESKFAAFLLAGAFLLNPSVGFLTAWSGFHGVTAVIPFFLAAFYIFDKNYYQDSLNKKNLTLFWIFIILTMMGKEQLPLYIFVYGLFIFLLRNREAGDSFKVHFKTLTGKLGLSMMAVSLLWFYLAFFVIIPSYAHFRVEGYERFAQNLGIVNADARDVVLPNYFLNRYAEFGDSYLEVAKNMVLNPRESVRVFFGGDKVENFRRTFEPLAFLPFAFPLATIMAGPDLLINFMTTADGVGTSEITNHRISMILPILFIATILAIKYLSGVFSTKIKVKKTTIFLSLTVFGFSIYTTHFYNNPIYLWSKQAFQDKIVSNVFAKTEPELIRKNLKVGDVVRLTELEDKDRECALKIVNMIPDGASVSGPDSFGAHLAKRETYAIFPALYNQADYVILDVFSRKITTILDLDPELNREIVERIIKSDNYQLKVGCGNYFVFKRVGPHPKDEKLPIQERYRYDEVFDYPFFQGVDVVDFSAPEELKKDFSQHIRIVYKRWGGGSDKNTSLEEYILFTSFVNKKTGEVYQLANLPSFALKLPEDWIKDRYYVENIEIVIPDFVESGDYMFFVGMGNRIRTRSIYLGDFKVD